MLMCDRKVPAYLLFILKKYNLDY